MKTIKKQAEDFIEDIFTNKGCIRLYCQFGGDKGVRLSSIKLVIRHFKKLLKQKSTDYIQLN